MTLGFDEAAAKVTAPGQVFETAETLIGGATYRVFVNAPPTLRDLFGALRAHGRRPFLVYGHERWSFAKVAARVDALAAALASLGVGKGERVAIAMRNLPEWVVAFGAALCAGAVAVPLNAWWTGEELGSVLADCGATVLVADPERVARTRAVLGATAVRATVAARWGRSAVPQGVQLLEDLTREPPPAAATPSLSPDDDALLLYTSGTSGPPKGVLSTHRAVLQALLAFGCAAAIAEQRRPGADEGGARVFILVVPLFHATGCIPVLLACTAMGYKLVMMQKWDPEAALALIERERVTNFVGVPTQTLDLMASPRLGDFDVSSLRSVGGGGAPTPPSLVRQVAARIASGQPAAGYGLTETNAYGPTISGDDYLARPASTGRTVPIMDVEVRDPAGRALPPGQRGEIWFRGPNLMRCYWNRPEETAATLVGGWLRTGDAGHLDAEGYLYVDDRLKDLVVRGGENVSCAEVEAAIHEHPAVREVAVLGLSHERLGEEVAAVVRLHPGASLDPDELRSFLSARLAAYKIPSRVAMVTDELPRGATGKVRKDALRGRFDA